MFYLINDGIVIALDKLMYIITIILLYIPDTVILYALYKRYYL